MIIGKRGSTLAMEEVVKFILGVIIVIFLIFLAVELFNIISSNVEKEQAKNTLENIVYQIEKAKTGETNALLVESPVQWLFVSNKTSLCICNVPASAFVSKKLGKDELFSMCSALSVCVQFELEVNITSYCNLRDLDKGSMWYSSGQAWKISSPDCLYINSAPKTIYFMKGVDTIYIGLSPGRDSSVKYDTSSWDGVSYFKHTVLKDETLYSVADLHSVNAEDIMILEGRKWWILEHIPIVGEGKISGANDMIYVGQTIRIPSYGVFCGKDKNRIYN